MKTIIIFFIITLPCILIVNESEYTILNLIGVLYTLLLLKLSYTEIGKKFIIKLWKAIKKLENKLFNY